MYSKVHDSARKLDDWAQSKLIVEKVEGVHPNQTCFCGRKSKTTREKLRNTFKAFSTLKHFMHSGFTLGCCIHYGSKGYPVPKTYVKKAAFLVAAGSTLVLCLLQCLVFHAQWIGVLLFRIHSGSRVVNMESITHTAAHLSGDYN